jgi:hypothetical protein
VKSIFDLEVRKNDIIRFFILKEEQLSKYVGHPSFTKKLVIGYNNILVWSGKSLQDHIEWIGQEIIPTLQTLSSCQIGLEENLEFEPLLVECKLILTKWNELMATEIMENRNLIGAFARHCSQFIKTLSELKSKSEL